MYMYIFQNNEWINASEYVSFFIVHLDNQNNQKTIALFVVYGPVTGQGAQGGMVSSFESYCIRKSKMFEKIIFELRPTDCIKCDLDQYSQWQFIEL